MSGCPDCDDLPRWARVLMAALLIVALAAFAFAEAAA